MTREEAIEVYNGLINTKIKEAFEFFVPELRKSEDERIRRTLVEYFGPSAQLDFIRGVPIQKIRDWLEKQKESPKTADSIPSDCASDAKCEDRWHKVTDSLPDNPREVLCKDEVGNYFIGRYYVGEGWDISNYDYEDKPNHLNPPVSKWIDFPSEKQKESLHIPETCKENADSFTDDESIRKWLVDYFKAVERCWIHWDISPERIVSYLEKQKEPKNVSATTMIPSCWEVEQKEQKPELCDMGRWDEESYNNGIHHVLQNPEAYGLTKQKPAEWSKEDERKRQSCISTINEVIDYERERWEDYNPGKPYRPIMKYDEQIEWLKALRPQPHWKPSEEQMEVDLGKEIIRYQREDMDRDTTVGDVARHFAKWQKEQMMEKWLKDRDGCFWDGVAEGKKAMEEQFKKMQLGESK